MKRLFLAFALLLAMPAEASFLGVGLGGGFRTSSGSESLLLRSALPRNAALELYLHGWTDAVNRSHPATKNVFVGAAYRLQRQLGRAQIGAALGGGVVADETFNLDKNGNVILAPFARIHLRGDWFLRCEIIHYSSVGDQPGENFAMCGSERELK